MFRFEVMSHIAQYKAIAIVREKTADRGRQVASAVVKAGLGAVEVTCTTPAAFDIIEGMRGQAAVIGAGTVLSPSEAVSAAHAGATFIVTPNVDADVIRTAHRHGLAAIIGCGTASEIVTALELGADAIKVFPAEQLGMGFLGAIHGPLPWAPLIPVGGVDPSNAAAWLAAGGLAVGMGSRLTAGDDATITTNVQTLLKNIGVAPLTA